MRSSLFLVVLVLATVVSCYEHEQHVLVLEESDYPSVIDEFPYVMIEFYAPWCGHCKQLAPDYALAAKLLAQKNSPVKLAKVDMTEQTKFGHGNFDVAGFPTLYFMMKGAKVKYDGTRTAEGLIAWIDKRMTPATMDIMDSDELAKLSESGKVSLVLFANDEKDINKFKIFSTQDDYNAYYIATGDLARTYDSTVVEIHRNFDETKTLQGLDDQHFLHWRRKYERPLVVPFDDRTIRYIFQLEMNAAVVFNVNSNDGITKVLEEVANNLNGDFIVTEVRPDNDNYKKLADFLKLRLTDQPVLIGLKSKEHKKAIYWEDVNALSYRKLKLFITKIAKGTEKMYPSDEVVDSPPTDKDEDSDEL